MDEFRTQFDRIAVGVLGEDAPADALSRFQHQHPQASRFQIAGGSQSGSTGANYDDIKVVHGISEPFTAKDAKGAKENTQTLTTDDADLTDQR